MVNENAHGPSGPSGLMYLASMLRNEHDIQIIDAFNLYLSDEDILQKIYNFQPQVVGLSALFLSQVTPTLQIAKRIKDSMGRVKVVLGGNSITFLAERLKKLEYIDAIILHEGEISFKEYIRRLERGESLSGIPGSIIKEKGEIIENRNYKFIDNLDKLPFPSRDLLSDPLAYSKSVVTGRGCPFNCMYCSTKKMWGRYRRRSAQNIVEEIKEITQKFNSNVITFSDDNFTAYGYHSTKQIYDLLIENKIALNLGLSARIDLVNDRLLELLAKMGVTKIFFGVESGSERVLKILGRNYSTREVIDKVDRCVKLGIIPVCSFMFGFPFETIEDIKKTFDLMERVNTCYVQCHILALLPGTEIYKKAELFGLKLIEDFDFLNVNFDNQALFFTPYLSREKLMELYTEGESICQQKFMRRWMYKKRLNEKMKQRI